MSKPLAVLDCECYRNYFLVKIRRIADGAVAAFEMWPGVTLDRARLEAVLNQVTMVTFNGIVYDNPMLGAALAGMNTIALKTVSDAIIQRNMRPWDVEREFGFRVPQFDHIDLIEVVPTNVSLKVMMGRLHCRKLQDLPIEHDQLITPEQRALIYTYNDNDLDGTEALLRKFWDQIRLRVQMSNEYGVDLRSKSDAQIAEAIIKQRLTSMGIVVKKVPITPRAFKYRFPEFMRHAGPIVQAIMARVAAADFVVKPNGYVDIPDEIADMNIVIGASAYRMGNGGLHSMEKSVEHYADSEYMIVDRDVASYYPAIIIQTQLYPAHLGPAFLEVYRRIRDQRIVAKREGNKSTADTLKIVLNGSFGKFGNPYSTLYSPDLLLQTTITGQLALLMLIEHLERDGIQVISANTDGIVIKCRRDAEAFLLQIIAHWEQVTGFETEETRYKSIHSRDVNSYIALKEKGGVKLKGEFAEPEPVASSWPSPHNQICVTAACKWLEHRIPIEWTIALCNDIREFVEVRNVRGGGMWRGEYLGRAVRWYHTADGEPILLCKANAKGTHAKVADTDLCRPLMTMDGSMPSDLDKQWYVREAYDILKRVGHKPRVNPN